VEFYTTPPYVLHNIRMENLTFILLDGYNVRFSQELFKFMSLTDRTAGSDHRAKLQTQFLHSTNVSYLKSRQSLRSHSVECR
jgi:hypothetical protein